MKKIASFYTAISLDLAPKIIFGTLADQAGSILLDSGQTAHENSRYDIILSSPLFTLSYQHGETEIKNWITNNTVTTHDSDPLLLAEQYWQQTKPENTVADIPFSGGIVGWFSYDLGRAFETLPNKADIDFNCPQMHIGIYDWALIYDNDTKQWFALDYQPALNRVGSLIDRVQSNLSGVNADLNDAATINYVTPSPFSETNSPLPFTLQSDWQSNMSKAQYAEKFARVKHYLFEGDCYQINLAQRFKASYTGCIWSAYQTLTTHNRAPFSAFIKTDNVSVMSISPERFIKLHNGVMETKPIKGTLPRSNDPLQDKQNAEQLKHSNKDRAENLMIVDLLRNDLSKVAQAGSVEVPKLFDIESFPAVHHLVSTITAVIDDDKNAFDLLRGAFPGGSITGAPKIRAMEIIEELEPHRRHVYCGSIGYIDWNGNMDTNIAIRTLVADEQHIYCWAGGGLVYDSKMDSEYQETFDKVAKILPILSNCS